MDPGGRSGWASALMDVDRLEMTGSGVLRDDRMSDWLAVQQGITGPVLSTKLRRAGVARKPRFTVVVFESWYPRRDAQGRMDWIEGSPLLEARHIGQIEFIARLSGARIITQHPSDKPQAVATMPQELLDWDRDSNEQHDKDARMHLWLYFWREWFSATVDPSTVMV